MKGLDKKITFFMSHSPFASCGNPSSNKKIPTNEPTIRNQVPHQGRVPDPDMDPRKLKRVMASRQYSQKYRLKQLQYILQLEKEVKALQAEVAITLPRIKYVDCQNSLLRIQNVSMNERLSAFSTNLMFKEAQYEELKKERDMLKQFYVINQPQQLPDFLKIKPVDNYQLLNFNLNHTAFNPFLEPAAVGMSQIMINQNMNQTYYE